MDAVGEQYGMEALQHYVFRIGDNPYEGLTPINHDTAERSLDCRRDNKLKAALRSSK
jgi:hypothetical protein